VCETHDEATDAYNEPKRHLIVIWLVFTPPPPFFHATNPYSEPKRRSVVVGLAFHEYRYLSPHHPFSPPP
jgi:hypothetical protein